MESRAKVLGHAIHPMLIVFPLGLLATAVIFDVLFLITDRSGFTVAAAYAIAAGVVGGLAHHRAVRAKVQVDEPVHPDLRPAPGAGAPRGGAGPGRGRRRPAPGRSAAMNRVRDLRARPDLLSSY